MTSQLIARDGLRARDSGTWARDKLSFLDEFGPPALTATTRKHQRCYIDLFAGPGLNIDRSTGEEFDGSPLRILGMTSSIDPDIHFTHAVFVNKTEADHEALAVRVDRCCAEGRSFIPRERIGIRHGDANIVIRDIMATIPALAYVLLFADIEAPKQFPWSSVLDIKRLGHASVDLYILFPLEMAIQRLIAFQGGHMTERHATVLTNYFGTEEWRAIAAQRLTDAHSPRLRIALEQLYLAQLRTRWTNASSVKDVRIKAGRRLYRMLFASKHDAGAKIARWAKQRGERGDQLGLF